MVNFVQLHTYASPEAVYGQETPRSGPGFPVHVTKFPQ